MQNSKKFLMRFVKVMFLFNSCLVPGCIFTCQNSVSAHDLTAREFFKDIMNQINSNGGYTGTGMPFGFSNGEECVYIPCANGADIIVPKQITEFISSDFNMYFHNLVLQYSLKSTSPVPAPMSYPTLSSMMPPVPAPMPYPTPSSMMPPAPAPIPYPTPSSMMPPAPAPVPYPTPSSMMPPAPAPVPYPTPSSTAPSYIPTSVDAI